MNNKTFTENDLQKVKDFLEQMRNMRFTSSGYKSLDVLTNGLMRGGVTLIAARPAMGKFSFVLNMVSRLSQQITGDVLIFSPRFRETEVTIRLLEIGTGLKAAEFFNGSLSTENLRNKCTDYFNSQLSRIQIEDLISPSLEDVQWYPGAKIEPSKNGLREVVFHNHVGVVGHRAFGDNAMLGNVVGIENVEYIEEDAFAGTPFENKFAAAENEQK